MYDELVKQLREKAGAFDYDGRPDIACDYEQAADAIEKLSKDLDNWKATAQEERDAYRHWFDQYQKDVPRWIPVAKRLPEDDTAVLAHVYWPEYGDTMIAYGHWHKGWCHLFHHVEGELYSGYVAPIGWLCQSRRRRSVGTTG